MKSRFSAVRSLSISLSDAAGARWRRAFLWRSLRARDRAWLVLRVSQARPSSATNACDAHQSYVATSSRPPPHPPADIHGRRRSQRPSVCTCDVFLSFGSTRKIQRPRVSLFSNLRERQTNRRTSFALSRENERERTRKTSKRYAVPLLGSLESCAPS